MRYSPIIFSKRPSLPCTNAPLFCSEETAYLALQSEGWRNVTGLPLTRAVPDTFGELHADVQRRAHLTELDAFKLLLSPTLVEKYFVQVVNAPLVRQRAATITSSTFYKYFGSLIKHWSSHLPGRVRENQHSEWLGDTWRKRMNKVLSFEHGALEDFTSALEMSWRMLWVLIGIVAVDETIWAYTGEDMILDGAAHYVPRKPHDFGVEALLATSVARYSKKPYIVCRHPLHKGAHRHPYESRSGNHGSAALFPLYHRPSPLLYRQWISH